MEYSIDIDLWDHKVSAWVPYEANDITLEFVMMDPYVRMFLTKDSDKKSSRYYANFRVIDKKWKFLLIYYIFYKLPDKYGVFHFKTIYRKPGYTFLNEATKVNQYFKE